MLPRDQAPVPFQLAWKRHVAREELRRRRWVHLLVTMDRKYPRVIEFERERGASWPIQRFMHRYTEWRRGAGTRMQSFGRMVPRYVLSLCGCVAVAVAVVGCDVATVLTAMAACRRNWYVAAKASAIKLQSIARFFLVVQWCVSPPRHVSVALPRRPTPLD